MQYTRRRNVNRGYMGLQVWQESMDLLKVVHATSENMRQLDFRLRSQIVGCAQSISANIAEGYCRRTIREYINFVGIALGSTGELMTRMAGLRSMEKITADEFEVFDRCHYSVENKLIQLKRSLEAKKRTGEWQEEL